MRQVIVEVANTKARVAYPFPLLKQAKKFYKNFLRKKELGVKKTGIPSEMRIVCELRPEVLDKFLPLAYEIVDFIEAAEKAAKDGE